MKISQRLNSRSAGLTLIEVTLVVAVLLGLISVLFIGATSYKEGTDRAQCILTISAVQKAVRSYQNLNELEVGDVVISENLVGKDRLLEFIHPCGSQTLPGVEPEGSDAFAASGYTVLGRVPESGTPYASCKTADLGHIPNATSDW